MLVYINTKLTKLSRSRSGGFSSIRDHGSLRPNVTVVVQGTATTLTVEREGSDGTAGQEGSPKVVVMAVPQADGGVRIKVRGNDRVGVRDRQGLWTLWAENLPKRQH